MSLIFLPDNWKRFGSGRKWRCSGPKYLCEVDDAGNTPNYLKVTGSPRPDSHNTWNLRQYGNHLDRWVAFYNTSRMI